MDFYEQARGPEWNLVVRSGYVQRNVGREVSRAFLQGILSLVWSGASGTRKSEDHSLATRCAGGTWAEPVRGPADDGLRQTRIERLLQPLLDWSCRSAENLGSSG